MDTKINHGDVLVVDAHEFVVISDEATRAEALAELKATDSCYGYYFFDNNDDNLDTEGIGRDDIDWTGFQG